MELLKRSIVLAAALSAAVGLAACQTSGKVGASGDVRTPSGAGASGGVSGGASGSVDTPNSSGSGTAR